MDNVLWRVEYHMDGADEKETWFFVGPSNLSHDRIKEHVLNIENDGRDEEYLHTEDDFYEYDAWPISVVSGIEDDRFDLKVLRRPSE